jgi:membrane associated rhomboid family serine protease
MMFWHLLPASHRVLLALSIVYVVNALALHSMLTPWLALIPAETVGKWQYWRFLTYPFAVYGWNILPASFVLYFFAPEVEHLLSPRKLMLTMLLFTLLHAVIYTPLMLLANAPLGGPQALSLMVLTMYVYLYPTGEASLFGIIPIRATVLLAVILGVAFVAPLLFPPVHAVDYIHVFADELFGVFAGLLFAYLYFGRSHEEPLFARFGIGSGTQDRSFGSTPRRTTPSAAPVGFTALSSSDLAKPLNTPISESVYDDNDELDEDRLNEILDKINEKGQASLTGSEKKFLQEYARKL